MSQNVSSGYFSMSDVSWCLMMLDVCGTQQLWVNFGNRNFTMLVTQWQPWQPCRGCECGLSAFDGPILARADLRNFTGFVTGSQGSRKALLEKLQWVSWGTKLHKLWEGWWKVVRKVADITRAYLHVFAFRIHITLHSNHLKSFRRPE